MIRRTFQLIPKLGPWREKDLWARGVGDWDAFPRTPAEGVALSPKQDEMMRGRIARARAALKERDLKTLAELLPPREHWRLYREFRDEAVFFDVEAEGKDDKRPTVASLFDADGLHVFIAGRNLDALPAALAQRRLWITFNGTCFDLPVLRAHFPDLPTPEAHLDLRFILRRLGRGDGLKAIEDAYKLSRAPHLRGVRGWDAVLLWRAYLDRGDLEALRFLVEYNLYDAFNLKSLMDLAFNEAVERLNLPDEPRIPVFERGDILYDVSRLLLELGPTERDLRVLERLRAQDRQLREDFDAA
ncbi:MAG: ribonuclease H-like domain-containing protein [Myxococcaceae bacterium]|nr:ribonuclease H-like domain-containing protein [Myxococcaceae bacterium]